MKEKKVLVMMMCLVGWINIWAQQKQTYTGTVYDATTQDVIIGASVKVVGTAEGTITDFDGVFAIEAAAGSQVEVSYVGYTPQTLELTPDMKILLQEDIAQLDEVVVTALGLTRSEKTIGYAATTVKSDEIITARQSNVANALAGKVAGVQVMQTSSDPGAATNVVIRGFSSIGGSNQPLYVVDGVPMQNTTSSGHGDQNEKTISLSGISNIASKDIESMTVLKGAAATALYGSRAANGVILITTKQGQKGAKRNFNIEYSGGVSFSQVTNLPTMQNQFGQGWNGIQTFNENGSWGPELDGSMQVYGPAWNNQQLLHKYEALETNIKDFFETGISQNHNVIFSGMSEDNKMSYYASYSYTGDNGVMPDDADTYKRHTLAFRGSYEPIKWLKVSSSVNFATSKTDVVDTYQGTSVIDGLYEFPRDISLVDKQDLSSPFNTPEAYYTAYGITNPYWAIANNYNHTNAKQIFGKAQVDIKPIEPLNITYRFGFDYTDNDQKIGVPQIDLDDAKITNDNGYEPSNMNQSGSVWAQYSRRYEMNHDILVNYKDKWGIVDFNGVVGVNINERGGTSMASATSNLTFNTDYWQLSNGSNKDDISESQYKRRSVGLFADITVGVLDQVYIDLTARNDWSSTLPLKANSYFYPGITASWIFSEIIPQNKYFTFGKLRAAYGMTGNDASVYLTNPTYTQAYTNSNYIGGVLNFPLNGTNAFISSATLGSSTLKPEMTREAEVGLNVQFFGGRLGLDATYYHRITDDQIFTLPVDPSTGYRYTITNFGSVRNQGVELVLNTTPVQIGGFRWDLDFNVAYNDNKVLSLPDGLDGGKSLIESFSTSLDAVNIYAEVGKPLGEIYTYLPSYTADGKIICGSDGLPIIDSDLKDTGKNIQSKWTGGITTSLSYMGVSLSATLDARLGGYIFSRTKNLMEFTGNGIVTTYNGRNPFIVPNSVVLDEATGEYVENTTPIYQYNGSYQDYFDATGAGLGGEFYLINRSYAKLRNISLSWDLPKKWVNKIALDQISISAYVNNVWTWKAKDNYYIDPEATSYGGDGDLAAQFGELYSNPSCRQYGINLNVKF